MDSNTLSDNANNASERLECRCDICQLWLRRHEPTPVLGYVNAAGIGYPGPCPFAVPVKEPRHG